MGTPVYAPDNRLAQEFCEELIALSTPNDDTPALFYIRCETLEGVKVVKVVNSQE